MADFYKDKEMIKVMRLCSALDRRRHLLDDMDVLIRSLAYQVQRTDKGISILSRAELITMMYHKYRDMKDELKTLNDEIGHLKIELDEFSDEGEDNGSDD